MIAIVDTLNYQGNTNGYRSNIYLSNAGQSHQKQDKELPTLSSLFSGVYAPGALVSLLVSLNSSSAMAAAFPLKHHTGFLPWVVFESTS